MSSSAETAAEDPPVDSGQPSGSQAAPIVVANAPLPADQPLPALTVACRALGLLALAGWSVGMLLGVAVLKGDLERFVIHNALGMTGRHFVLGAMFAGAAVAGAAGAAFLFARR